MALLLFSSLCIFVYSCDSQILQEVQNADLLSEEVEEWLDGFGQETRIKEEIGKLYAINFLWAKDKRLEKLCFAGYLSQEICNSWVTALKHYSNRERPDGSNFRSFPSGHTATAFSLATVVWKTYGWKLGLPFYLIACGVGIQRMERNRHYPTDVLVGAGLGFLLSGLVYDSIGAPNWGWKYEHSSQGEEKVMVASIYWKF